MAIIKATLTVTVLVSAEDDELDDMTLAEIAEEMDDGAYIGAVSITSRETITDPDEIRAALLAVGNDGNFFDSDA